MQRHYDHYQMVLTSEEEMKKYSESNLRYMREYTPEFIQKKQDEILGCLKSWHGEDAVTKMMELL